MNRPAIAPAAISLKSIFRNSGKKNLIVTGSKKIGKSTLLRAAFPDISHSLLSTAVMSVHTHPDRILLGCSDCPDASVIGIYRTDHMEPQPEGFLPGIQTIERFITTGAESVLIDEIGFLESASLPYQQALERLFDAVPVIASVRKQSTPLIDRLTSREDTLVVDLDDWYGRDVRIGCIVMASGFATRFKSNKLLADFGGKPLISHLLENLCLTPGCTAVVVTRYPEVQKLAENAGLKSVLHNEPALSDTIRLGIDALPGMDGYMLCVADQPYLTSETLAALVTMFRSLPDQIIRVRCGDTPGNPVIFPARFKSELQSLTGENGGRTVIRAHMDALRFLDITDARELFDIDTADALPANP